MKVVMKKSNKSGIDTIFTIRNAIYILGIVAFIIAVLIKSCHASEPQAFWPPDLIPHPHNPNDGPSGPGKPELV